MNKKQLVHAIAGEAEISQTKAERMLDAMKDAVQNALVNGETVSIRGFGTFAPKDCGARRCRNPHTGETIIAPAHRSVRFKPAEAIKELLK